MKQLLLLLLFPVICFGQGDQTIIKVPINNSGATEQAILHLPDDYGKTSTKYPLMVFLHGIGEGGTNPASIYGSSSAGGPAYFIAQGKFPTSFVNPKDKLSYKYIVLSPQNNEGWSTTAPELDVILTNIIKTYRVDEARIYLTGLSAGGEGVVEYVGQLQGNGAVVTTTHKIAAFMPMSAVMNGGYEAGYATKLVAANTGLWGFGSPSDTHGQNTLNLVWYANQDKANSAISTSYSGGHCCWGQFYDPNFRQNGMSIYEWALQYTQGTSSASSTTPAVAPSTPVFTPSSAVSITLPTSSVTVSGSSTVLGSSITTYAWTKVSGGAATIVSPSSASTAFTGLTAGTYVFQLKVTALNLLSSTSNVTITVNPAPVVSVPTANAGSAQTIQLPTSQVTLNGSASSVANGTIASYAWSKQTGGAATIQSPSSASTVVSGLVAGSYTFNLTITDNNQKTSSATVQVTVNSNTSSSLPVTSPPSADETISVPTNSSGATEKALVHLPDDYSSTSTNYPLLVFLHNENLGGSNPAAISGSTDGGPAYYIAQGKFPSSFVNPADNKSYKFIVVSPQNPVIGSNSATELESILTYLYKTYRVDASRVYLSGEAAGGGGVLEYVGNLLSTGNKVNATHRIAAFIPMSAYMNAGYRSNYVDTIVHNNVYMWGFGSNAEMNGANTLGLAFLINLEPGAHASQTEFSGGLCCYGQFYNPTFKQNGMNIYEWALQYTQSSSVGSALPIPGKIEAEAYSAMSNVAMQTTTDAGGGSNVGWIDKSDYMDYSVNVAAAGQYTASLRVATPNSGTSAQLLSSSGAVLATVNFPNTGGFQTWQTATVSVNLPAGNQVLRLKSTSNGQWNINWMQFASGATAGALAIPGKIEAESYSAMSNVTTQVTTDAGGGSNVGWIDKSDYMDYSVNVAAAGNYTASLRIATPNSGTSAQLLSSSGAVLATINFPNTGGFQTWQTATVSVNLPAGNQVLRLKSTSNGQWNINWMQFLSGTTASSVTGTAVGARASVMTGETEAAVLKSELTIFPNPVHDQLNLRINNDQTGNMLVQITDAFGAVRGAYNYGKSSDLLQVSLSTANLTSGVYFVRVQVGNKSEVKKIVKL